MKYIDLHVHSNSSDGSDSPADIVKAAAASGLAAVALTDHDTVSGLYAGFGTWPSGDNVQYDNRIGQHVECHSDSIELSIIYFIGFQYFRFGQIGGVWVEFIDDQRKNVERTDQSV